MLCLARTLASFVLLVCLAGCTTLAKWQSPNLHGSPNDTGLVVIDCHASVISAFIDLHTKETLVEGLLSGEGSPPQTCEGSAVSGSTLLVFSGVKPGRWTFTSFNADWQGGDWTYRYTYQPILTPGMDEHLTFDVRAGEPTYVGVLDVVDHKKAFDKSQVEVNFQPSIEAEAKAWKYLLEVYGDSPWAEKVRAKLASAPAAAAAGHP